MKKKIILVMLMTLALSAALFGCSGTGAGEEARMLFLSAEELLVKGDECSDNMDYENALKYYEKAWEKENGTAANNIGYMYQLGQGVERDYAKAMEYYEMAAEMGNATALSNIGYFYDYGYGVEIDYDKAKEY